MKATFVSSNQGKIREVRMILGSNLEVANLELEEIQSMDAEEVARKKVLHAYSILKRPVFVEDTGLHIEGMGGFPGPMVKWMIKGLGYEGICRAVDSCGSRKAYAVTCAALYDGKKIRTFKGRLDGEISMHPRGNNIFGWDHIFIPKGQTRTFAEMLEEEKAEISMRSMALKKLKHYLGQAHRHKHRGSSRARG